MLEKEKLQEYLQLKIARTALLKQRKEDLEALNFSLYGSRFGRFFGTSYFFVKRLLTLLVGIALLVPALVLIINPEIILEDEGLKQIMISDYKKEMAEVAGLTLEEALISLSDSGSDITPSDLIIIIDNSLEAAITEKLKPGIIGVGLLLLILGFVLLYISRQAKKVRRRNNLISSAESLTQDIIKDYKQTITEQEQELEMLQVLVNGTPPSQ